MARRIHLVRHGEVHNPSHIVYASLPGFGLSEQGRAQAKEVARYLRAAPVVAVWSSPLERAIATAEPVAASHGLPIRIEEDLGEWRMADEWAGIRWEALPSERPGELEAYLEHPLDMPFASESLPALASRMRDALLHLAESHDGDVVVVSHQDPVQAARLAVTGRDLAGQHREKPQHGTVITLTPGTPWRELMSWSPEQGETFPPPADESRKASAGRHVDTESGPEQLGIGLEGERG